VREDRDMAIIRVTATHLRCASPRERYWFRAVPRGSSAISLARDLLKRIGSDRRPARRGSHAGAFGPLTLAGYRRVADAMVMLAVGPEAA